MDKKCEVCGKILKFLRDYIRKQYNYIFYIL